MIDQQFKQALTVGFASVLVLMAAQTGILLLDGSRVSDATFLLSSLLLTTAGFIIVFLFLRQLRQREQSCHVENAKVRKALERLKWQASHDSLTGLVNRREFRRRVMAACVSAQRKDSRHVVALINLDRFKTINDHCGHRAGDTLLSQLPALLKPILSKEDTLARIGGDEFALLLPDADMHHASQVVKQIQKKIRQFRLLWNGRHYEIGASIGVVPISRDYCHLQEVLTAADTACQEAKNAGRNRVCLLDSGDRLLAERQAAVRCAQELPRAIREGRLELHAQEIRSIGEDYQGRHYELLVRMNQENGAQMQPDQFIPVAEQYGLAVDLDRWVVNEALTWLRARNRSISSCSLGDQCHCRCRVSINLSGQSISDREFLQEIRQQFIDKAVDPELVIFEITETAAITNLESARYFMKELKAIGCRFALDDFGSGMSSFGYLQQLDVDYVKIDGSLVTHIAKGGLENAMINAIVHVANAMNAHTIAEYVEDKLTQQSLESSGVDFVQGFLVHKPVPLKSLRFCADEMAETQQLALAV